LLFCAKRLPVEASPTQTKCKANNRPTESRYSALMGDFLWSGYLPSDAADAIIIDCSNVNVAVCLIAIRE